MSACVSACRRPLERSRYFLLNPPLDRPSMDNDVFLRRVNAALTHEKARRIAPNFAKLPELLRRG